MKAKTIQGNTVGQLGIALQQSRTKGFNPTLAIVFASVKQDIGAIRDLFNREQITVFGATTAGEFIDGHITSGACAVMLLDISPALFRVALESTVESNVETATRRLGELGKQLFSNPAYILVADGWNPQGFTVDGSKVVRALKETVGSDAVILGGLSADDLSAVGSLVFTNHQCSTGSGILALIIDLDKVSVAGVSAAGWQPVGVTRTITRSDSHVVYTMDDVPALDLMCRFTGLTYDHSDTDLFFNFGDFSPIQLLKDDNTSVFRETRAINLAERSIIYSGTVPQGSKFRFSLPPDFTVIDSEIADCERLRDEQQPEADAVLLFSCPMRRISFGPLIQEEIEGIMQVWQSPLAGFCTYGEFGRTPGGQTEFHTNTTTVVTLKEKP